MRLSQLEPGQSGVIKEFTPKNIPKNNKNPIATSIFDRINANSTLLLATLSQYERIGLKIVFWDLQNSTRLSTAVIASGSSIK